MEKEKETSDEYCCKRVELDNAKQQHSQTYEKVPPKWFKECEHHGQWKLYLSEMDFLTDQLDSKDDKCIVVYAGAAPGPHLQSLIPLFPGLVWHLFDPQPIAVPPSERVHVHGAAFDDKEATKWSGGKCDFFISDIRCGAVAGGKEDAFEDQVWVDMQAQARWVKVIQPKKALLKFRVPYNRKYIMYFDGELRVQAYAKRGSTECRLVTDGKSEKKYELAPYEDWFFYHNLVCRPCRPPFCSDCNLAAFIRKRYETKFGKTTPPQTKK